MSRKRIQDGVEYVFDDYIDDPVVWQRLADAIIKNAVDEYRIVRDEPDRKSEKRSIERFFRSKWFDLLTLIDGRWLLRLLKEEGRKEQQ